MNRITDDIGGGPTLEAIPVWPEAGEEARRSLGEEKFEKIRAEGYAMSLDEAVAYALHDGG